jgi:hypothetical protein
MTIDPNSRIFYKIQPPNGCRNHTFYNVGQTYTLPDGVDPVLGKVGFHAYSSFRYYFDRPGYDSTENKYLAVQTNHAKKDEDIKGCKCGMCVKICSNEMKIIKELTESEVLELFENDTAEWDGFKEPFYHAGLCDFSMCHVPPFLKKEFKSLLPGEKTHNVCKSAYKNNPRNFEFIPSKHKSKNMCMGAIKKHPYLVQFVPKKYWKDPDYIRYKAYVDKALGELKCLSDDDTDDDDDDKSGSNGDRSLKAI